MRVIYSSRYHIDIGAHVFPTRKYQLLHDRIRERVREAMFIEASPASWDELALVHTPEYLQKAKTGGFTSSELAQLELPWSPGVVEGFRLMTGGTIAAAREVMSRGAGAEGEPV